MITALSISRNHVYHDYKGIKSKCLSGRNFQRSKDVQKAWFDAIRLVTTDYFFYIDDTDLLPPNYLNVLSDCISANTAIAYTDELVGNERRIRGPYSQRAHLENPALVHHLTLCKTDIAIEAVSRLPKGNYWPEMLLYWEMAKLGGATYIPEIGYIWNKEPTGLHNTWFTIIGISNSFYWCSRNP